MNPVVRCSLRSSPWCWKSLASMSKSGSHMHTCFVSWCASLVATPPPPPPPHTHTYTHTVGWPTSLVASRAHAHTHCELACFSGCYTHKHTHTHTHTHAVSWPASLVATHTHKVTHTLWAGPLLWLLHTHTHTVSWPTSLVATHTHTHTQNNTVNWPTSLVARRMENALLLTSPCIDSPPGDLPQCPRSVTHVLLVTTCAVSCTDCRREHVGRGSVWQKLCQINGWVCFVLNVF